ncbi:MAG: hypothetical protein KY476_14640 [Planctomycetes bacterium]|nr:hypothetical protein [Planctomycetota bacterium]
MAIMSLKKDRTVCSLIYVLWDHVREYPAKEDWPFSESPTRWMYDELDLAADHQGAFLHRILFSDGGIVEIPFSSALISIVTLPSADEGAAKRRTA